MRIANIEVRRGPMESIAKTVWAHEVPILAAMFGDSAITVHDQKDGANNVDPLAEHARLARCYGEHPKAGIPYVEYVYGLPSTGRLEQAMAARKRAQ